jgi:hypothetical protein
MGGNNSSASDASIPRLEGWRAWKRRVLCRNRRHGQNKSDRIWGAYGVNMLTTTYEQPHSVADNVLRRPNPQHPPQQVLGGLLA